MVAVGEDLRLVRQVRAAGVHEVDARQPVLPRNLLRAQMLLHRHRIIGAALDRGVVAHDHAFAPRHAANAGDDARGVDVAVIHAVRGQRRQFEERRPRIEQLLHPRARQQLATFGMPLARPLIAAERGIGHFGFEVGDQPRHRLGISFVVGSSSRN